MIELFAEAGTGESISAAGVIAGFVAIALALVELSKYAIGRAFPSPAEREIQQHPGARSRDPRADDDRR